MSDNIYDTVIINNIKSFFFWLKDNGIKKFDIEHMHFSEIEDLAKRYVQETYYGDKK